MGFQAYHPSVFRVGTPLEGRGHQPGRYDPSAPLRAGTPVAPEPGRYDFQSYRIWPGNKDRL
jgi:hypothetical protein